MTMWNNKLSRSLIILFLTTLIIGGISNCKKLELLRIAAVTTGEAQFVTWTQARFSGNIIDLGDDESLTDYGFCWIKGTTPPTLDNYSVSFGPRTSTGTFDETVTSLQEGTKYSVRAYVQVGSSVYYGNLITFETAGGNPDLPTVSTSMVTNISQSSATCGGNVSDAGSSFVNTRGVCWSTLPNPTITGSHTMDGSGLGSFTSDITGLLSETTYYVRAYATNSDGTAYGEQRQFKTTNGTTPSPAWLHYDDGTFYTSIGFPSSQTDFDIAIRFPAQDIQDYVGFKITKINFLVVEGAPTEYYITWWTGSGPDLIADEQVVSPQLNVYATYTPDYVHVIEGGTDLWVGLWIVGAPAGTYPMGTDNGPAISYFGDLISTDNGDTWEALSIANPELDYNWNLQIYVTNEKGVEMPLVVHPSIKEKTGMKESSPLSEISSAKKQMNNTN